MCRAGQTLRQHPFNCREGFAAGGVSLAPPVGGRVDRDLLKTSPVQSESYLVQRRSHGHLEYEYLHISTCMCLPVNPKVDF